MAINRRAKKKKKKAHSFKIFEKKNNTATIHCLGEAFKILPVIVCIY